MDRILLEICAGSVASAVAADTGGADRIELCTALGEGGLTPSYGMMAEVKKRVAIPVHVLIRPREGDFLYTPAEVRQMCADIAAARDVGAEGVVCGALERNGVVDRAVTARLIRAAAGLSFTFHRAFDLCRDPFEAFRTLAALGVHTLLTSGQAATAAEGRGLIKELVALAQPQEMVVMPGCGIRAANIAGIVAETGVGAVHLSARRKVKSVMRYHKKDVAIGNAGAESEYDYYQTDASEVRACREALDADKCR